MMIFGDIVICIFFVISIKSMLSKEICMVVDLLVIIRRTNYVPSENDTIIVTLERVQRYRFIISLKDGGTFDPPRIDGAESEQVKSCLVLSCHKKKICKNVLKGRNEAMDKKLNAMACNEVKEFTGNKKWNGAIFNVKKQEYIPNL